MSTPEPAKPSNVTNITDFMSKPRAFIRVYECPQHMTDGYCFGYAKPITFLNVDWFEHVLDEKPTLVEFIKGKNYFDPKKRYMVQSFETDEYCFCIQPEKAT